MTLQRWVATVEFGLMVHQNRSFDMLLLEILVQIYRDQDAEALVECDGDVEKARVRAEQKLEKMVVADDSTSVDFR